MDLILLLAWWLIGLGAFVYWASKDLDITVTVLLFGCVLGFGGPFNIFIGWVIHGKVDGKPVLGITLFKKRGDKDD